MRSELLKRSTRRTECVLDKQRLLPKGGSFFMCDWLSGKFDDSLVLTPMTGQFG
jgi:hypothetical protein